MQETPTSEKTPTTEANAAVNAERGKTRRLRKVGIVCSLLIVAAIAAALYGSDTLSPILRQLRKAGSDRLAAGPFAPASPDSLISSESVLRAVGSSPVNPSKVLFPVFDKAGDPEQDKKAKSCPPAQMPSTGPAEGLQQANQQPLEASGPTDGDEASDQAGSSESPTVSAREPSPIAPPEVGDSDQVTEKPTAEQQSNRKLAARRGPSTGAVRFDERHKSHSKTDDGKLETNVSTSSTDKPASSAESGKGDQFQLPGSLTVKIHGYTGTVPQWGLMVILDDSALMGKKLKSWNPSRMTAAAEFLSKLPESLTSGSKMAVRDFKCGAADKSDQAAKGTCLSHVLLDWSNSPFKGLKEKLDQAEPAGKNNPCAAVSYTLKKDFGGLKGQSPRLLVITEGTAKCSISEVMKAIDSQGLKDKLSVDVVAVGMRKKRQDEYAKLAKGTNGLFFRVDKPADIETALTRYGKALKTPLMEKVEIKGGKAAVSMNPDEEITLAPGSYTVMLPAVAGIPSSKRAVENVIIKSAEATLVQIRVKKGKPVAKITKK